MSGDDKVDPEVQRRLNILENPKDEFFSGLSDEDKQTLQEAANNNNQSDNIKKIFGEASLEKGESKEYLLQNYKDENNEKRNIKRMNAITLEDQIKALESQQRSLDQKDDEYLQGLKDAVKEREQSSQDIFRNKLNQLSEQVKIFRSYKRGTRTQGEYEQIKIELDDLYRAVQSYKTKTAHGQVKELENDIQQVYQQLLETNHRADINTVITWPRRIYRYFRFGSLKDGDAPEKYSSSF